MPTRFPIFSSVQILPGVLSAALIAALAGCDSPSGPGDGPATEYLAGGGRVASEDAFIGGRSDSGPATPGAEPGRPDIAPWYFPVFYSEVNCFNAPFTKVLHSETEWKEWLGVADSCRPDYPEGWKEGTGSGGTGSEGPAGQGTEPDRPPPPQPPPPDSTVSVDPDEPPFWDPYVVDFDESVVVAIGLESVSMWGRSLHITDVITNGGVTTVRYEVSSPGDDCMSLLLRPIDVESIESAPVLAVAVPRPIGGTVTFVRTHTVWHCVIEPDPRAPLTLYYTDGECDLGPAEAIMRDATKWEEWLDTAADCDVARWGGGGVEPALPEDVRGKDSAASGVLIDPPISWLSPSVDFSTHAVLILRAPSQARWGGGIWLTGIEAANTGTTIDYAVMAPGADCPVIDEGVKLRPTVAIRVPLPLPEPVKFRSKVETIDCRWEPIPMGEPNTGTPSGGGGSTGSGGAGTTGGAGQATPAGRAQ